MEFDKNGILNRAKAAQQSTVVMDEGLRAYMLKVYNYMATGILLTGIVALLTFKMSVVTNDAGEHSWNAAGTFSGPPLLVLWKIQVLLLFFSGKNNSLQCILYSI